MKKILAIMLCTATIAGASAQKTAVDQAKKIAGKDLPAARELVKQAVSDPTSSEDPYTYYIGGKIEWDAYDKANQKLMINPGDNSVDQSVMPGQLLNGYNYFIKVLPLDKRPNEKGEIKPKYTKEILGKFKSHHEDFYRVGANAFNEQKFYPESYEAFMIYGDIPEMEGLQKDFKDFPDSIRATSYYNAGLAGWSANKLMEAQKAFKKARLAGYELPESYIYEIACWQNLAAKDSTLAQQAENQIMEVASAGYKKFGISQPLFINNMVNTMMNTGKEQEALSLLNELIASHPESPDLYGLRAFVYDRMKNDEASEADYRTAASLDGVSFDILKVAANKLIRTGTEKLNLLDPSNRAAKQELRDKYFLPAKGLLEKAREVKGGSDSDIDYLMDNLQYALENYFN